MHSSNSQNTMDVWETDGGPGAAALAPMESKTAWMLPVLTLTASDEVLRVNMASWMKGRLDSVSGRMREIVGRAVAAFRHARVRSGGSRSHPWVSAARRRSWMRWRESRQTQEIRDRQAEAGLYAAADMTPGSDR
jgi:hypothetical protein